MESVVWSPNCQTFFIDSIFNFIQICFELDDWLFSKVVANLNFITSAEIHRFHQAPGDLDKLFMYCTFYLLLTGSQLVRQLFIFQIMLKILLKTCFFYFKVKKAFVMFEIVIIWLMFLYFVRIVFACVSIKRLSPYWTFGNHENAA